MISTQYIRRGTLIGMNLLLLLAWADPSLAAKGFQEPMLQVQVESGRPLDEAVAFLARKHRWQVTYEDPAYYPLSEIRDLTHLRRDLHLYTPEDPAPRKLVPKGGSLFMDYSLMGKNGKPVKPEEVLQQLIDLYSRGNSPFTFHLVRNGDWLHVIPQPVKMQGGDFAAAILDTRISVPGEERGLGETLQLITKALTQETGRMVVIGSTPRRYLRRSRVGSDFHVQNEPARIALARLLNRFEVKFCWRLFHLPPLGEHILHLIPVPALPTPVIVPEQ